jgi:hypothetical protein
LLETHTHIHTIPVAALVNGLSSKVIATTIPSKKKAGCKDFELTPRFKENLSCPSTEIS